MRRMRSIERSFAAPSNPGLEKTVRRRATTKPERPLRAITSEDVAKASGGTPAKTLPQTGVLADARLDWKLLKRYDFDPLRFQRDQQRIANGTMNEASALVQSPLSPIRSVEPVTYAGQRAAEMRAIGEDALERGE